MSQAVSFRGSFVALPTPFRDGALDLTAFEALVDEHAASATDGIVVAGTSGEAATLSECERRTLIHAAVDFASGRLKVVAGVGTNCTRTTVDLARFASACGADGLLVVAPYYNRPSRRGLALHYGSIARATGAPIILYNVPHRTGVDLEPEIVRELVAGFENVVALKEATTSLARIRAVTAIDGLEVLCGDDRAIIDFMQAGAAGAISVVGNLLPDRVAELVREARPGGDLARAAAVAEALAQLVRDLSIEVNPVPLKTALAWLGRLSGEVRAPLAPLEEVHSEQLAATLQACGVLVPART